jgi:hypothetical protein
MVAMNETLVRYLGESAPKYPHRLAEEYPRVLEQVVALWRSPQRMRDYFSELMLPDRIGRQGFPREVASEIFELSLVFDAITGQPNRAEDVWGIDPTTARRELESLGLTSNRGALMKSVEDGDYSLCQLFLKAGVPVDARDARQWTALMVAAFHGNEKMALLLIRQGADVHAEDLRGYRPLHWAAYNGYLDVVNLLVKRRADLDAQSQSGLTPLLQAAARGHAAIVARLLEAGADPNVAADDGSTPLLKAVANRHLAVVHRLLLAGVDVHTVHQGGATPLSVAATVKHPGILRLLRVAAIASAGGPPPKRAGSVP